jgi:hypothetical protein
MATGLNARKLSGQAEHGDRDNRVGGLAKMDGRYERTHRTSVWRKRNSRVPFSSQRRGTSLSSKQRKADSHQRVDRVSSLAIVIHGAAGGQEPTVGALESLPLSCHP